MVRSLNDLSGWVTQAEWPRVLCPDCSAGGLAFVSANTFLDRPSREHVASVHRNQAGPDELRGSFSGHLRCDNHGCRRDVAVGGDWGSFWGWDDDRGDVLYDAFQVRFLNPAPLLLQIPTRTPEAVRSAVEHASEVLWLRPDAAATQLRLAVEHLLTSLKVTRYRVVNRRRIRRSAHERITSLKVTHPEVAEAIEAVKWIGNAGTHATSLSVQDVVKGAALLGLALRRLYDTTDADLSSAARQINARRGLPRK